MILRVLVNFAVWGSLLVAQVIRDAPISQFPQLPAAVRDDLRMRGCTVPQPPASREPANAIRGHFYDPHHLDWAVFCDIRKTSTSMLLVYRSGNLSQPAVLERSILNHACWTQIAPVGEAYIMEHYRAYGGPKPPPIDHQGIDVGLCEKASTVSYFYRNHWLTLTGSD